MNQLVKLLQGENKRQQHWQPGDLVLLAVSGGADSMALLDAFVRLPEKEKPKLAVLHVHHHLREEADEDCQIVQEYCRSRSIPCQVEHWEPHLHPKSGLEAAARSFRYAFFEREMQKRKAAVLATAHHADDQMETILMRLTRGSSLEGYAGIRSERSFASGVLIRPLLETSKAELYAYCAQYQVPYREDLTNEGLEFTRNRYRNQIVPLLKAENDQALQHFLDFSADLADLLETALPLVEENFQNCFEKKAEEWQLLLDVFEKYPLSIQRLLLGWFLQEKWSKEGIVYQRVHIGAILDLIHSKRPQAELFLSGGIVRKRYQVIRFISQAAETLENGRETGWSFSAEMNLNEWLELPFNGKIGLFLWEEGKYSPQLPTDSLCIRLGEETAFPLKVRFWESGDQMRLNKKAPFTKKISRIFIDRKIPLEERERAVVVVDANGKILWLPGFAHSIWTEAEEGGVLSENNGNNKKKVICFTKTNEVK